MCAVCFLTLPSRMCNYRYYTLIAVYKEYDWLATTQTENHDVLGMWTLRRCWCCGVTVFAQNTNNHYLLNKVDLRVCYGRLKE